MATGEAPFASELVGAPFALTEQERFVAEQVEATPRAALSNDGNMSFGLRRLTRLMPRRPTLCLEPRISTSVTGTRQARQTRMRLPRSVTSCSSSTRTQPSAATTWPALRPWPW